MESILHAARRLGYHDLREHQLDAAKKFLQGNDVLASLPTGSGKSLMYAVLPFAFDHLRGSEGSIDVVVSPLLSLFFFLYFDCSTAQVIGCACCDICSKNCPLNYLNIIHAIVLTVP